MQLQFEDSLDYQLSAIRSVIDLFAGQRESMTTHSLEDKRQDLQFEGANPLGIRANHLELTPEELAHNLQQLQLRAGLVPTPGGEEAVRAMQFNIEMETGTGKTYVYLRTLCELHQRYGFSKFIIVVPSIAIREGVSKSIELMATHFKSLYNIDLKPFVYNSARPNDVISFGLNPGLELMIINIDSFNKDENIINKQYDKRSEYPLINYIAGARPIVIIDEPQSVGSTDKSQKALASLKPLVTLRYSATHKEQYPLLYRLSPVDAYQMGLVKQIEVLDNQTQDDYNSAYISLVKVERKASRGSERISATLQLDCKTASGGIKRSKPKCYAGDNLEETTGRELYKAYQIERIDLEAQTVTFTNGESLALGQKLGDPSDEQIKQAQIRATVRMHLERELRLRPRGVKVLSLFFVDEVSGYRVYESDSPDGEQGRYARWLEEALSLYLNQPRYASLRREVYDKAPSLASFHGGYFARDNKDRLKDTSGNTVADESAYQLIMRDKERLLDEATPLRFIFSHSALREGWDNPNVFQICSLRELRRESSRRQALGRGLRLCVDQGGQRLRDKTINTLTVIADENYENFCEKLQKNYEEESGIRFGSFDTQSFYHCFLPVVGGEEGLSPETINEAQQQEAQQQSEALYQHLEAEGYILDGRSTAHFAEALELDTLLLPEAMEAYREQIVEASARLITPIPVRRQRGLELIQRNEEVYLSPEFQRLWERIKGRTFYRVSLDSEALIAACAERLSELKIIQTAVHQRRTKLNVEERGVSATLIDERYDKDTQQVQHALPNLVKVLMDDTKLKRETLVAILTRSKSLGQFFLDPQRYIKEALRIIKAERKHLLVDGIKYYRLEGADYELEEIFEAEMQSNSERIVDSSKSVYDRTVCDSKIELQFAETFERNVAVKCYVKLPKRFTIATPLGRYNPDWAVVVEQEGREAIYLVVESKGTRELLELRQDEQDKIRCAVKHFDTLDGVDYLQECDPSRVVLMD